MSSVTEDPDRLLLVAMTEPPPLEQARTSLEYWTLRRASLPLYRRSARREADEMIRRCRERVAAAERLCYGTGVLGFLRKVLAGEGPSWNALRIGFAGLVWMFVPRRLLVFVAAVAVAWLLVAVLVMAALAQLVT